LKYCQLIRLIVLVLMPLSPIQAEEPSPRDNFKAGVAAFEKGDLESAKQLMEQARDAGVSSSALRYNLGVVYYRLDLNDQAEAAFTELLDTTHAPLARYNLGLVLQQRGDTEGARRWFYQATAATSPEEIRTLARRQLNPNDDDSVAFYRPVETVSYLSSGAGYDDNITGTPSSRSTDQSGGFGEVLASGRAYLNRSGGRAIRVEAVGYRRQYPGSAEYNNTYLSTGLAWQSPVGAGSLVSAVDLSGLWFGGDLLERQAGVELTYNQSDCAAKFSCQLRGLASAIQGGSGYSAYDGGQYGIAASIEKTFAGLTAELGYRIDTDQREDLTSGDQFFSLSPTRHKFAVDLDYALSQRWTLGFNQIVRFSRYGDPHRLVTDGQTVSETREDDQFRTSLRSGYQIDERWRLGMELSWLDNKSTIERYDYNRTEIVVSLDSVF
jgi:tetratricopeptide (TPR) repeat protein